MVAKILNDNKQKLSANVRFNENKSAAEIKAWFGNMYYGVFVRNEIAYIEIDGIVYNWYNI